MMIHPEIGRFVADERLAALQRDARRALHPRAEPVDELSRIELRLCRVDDNPALERLAQLSERPLPKGSFVLAFVDGRLAAAHSLDGGGVLADPFVRTAHLRRLLELRAAQIEKPAPSRRFRLLGLRRQVA
jgi:hypothetical protein